MKNDQKNRPRDPQRIRAAERLRNRRMRNRLYGGVRGQVNTKRGEHLHPK